MDGAANCEGRGCTATTMNYYWVVVQGRQYRVCVQCLGRVLGALKAD
jgi:hypothetical protein